MKIKVQCGKHIHEFEGNRVTYREDFDIANPQKNKLEITVSKSGEYVIQKYKGPLGGITVSFCYEDESTTGIFRNWDGIIIEGQEETMMKEESESE